MNASPTGSLPSSNAAPRPGCAPGTRSTILSRSTPSPAARTAASTTCSLQLTAGALGYERNSWLTYRQAREAGGQVRGGEEGVGIIFGQLRKVPLVGDAFPVQEDSDIEERVIPLIRAYTVFNVVQVDGLQRDLTAAPPSVPQWQGQEIAELLIAESKTDIRHTGFRAYYQPQGDFIAIPPRAYFQDAAGYYGTTLHELCHWTGHPKRLDRQFGRQQDQGPPHGKRRVETS